MKKIVKVIQPIDIAILHDLYRYRMLTTRHILKKHFNGRSYGYRKIYILKNSGYITSFPLINKGRKETSCYRITDRGINLLQEKGIVTENIRAADLQVSKERLTYLNDINTIMVDLTSYGWEMKDSRETKQIYNLDRRSLIQGLLISPDGMEYGLYLIAGEAEEKTIVRALNEIDQPVIPNHIIFVKSMQSYNNFIKIREQNNIINQSIHLLTYSDYSLNVLKRLPTEKHFVNFFTKYFSFVQKSTNPNFDYVVEHEGEEKYLVNLMTNDLMRLFRVKKIYTIDRYRQDGRKVILVSPLAEQLKADFKHYPHIDVISLPLPEETTPQNTF